MRVYGWPGLFGFAGDTFSTKGSGAGKPDISGITTTISSSIPFRGAVDSTAVCHSKTMFTQTMLTGSLTHKKCTSLPVHVLCWVLSADSGCEGLGAW